MPPAADPTIPDAPPYWRATIPPLLSSLDAADRLVARVAASGRARELLSARLAPDMFAAGEQLGIAIGYALRIACPLAGVAAPDMPQAATETPAGLAALSKVARRTLEGLPRAGFATAASRRYRHSAGHAELDQDADTFLFRYGLPNTTFHIAMAYAVLRARGLPLGKADFDGMHSYPPGFRF